jgi:hypothetical protein
MNIEYPPFYIGQQVVAITDHENFKRGDKFIVKNIRKEKCCTTWVINIGVNSKDVYDFMACPICGTQAVNDDYYRAARFAPVEQLKYPLIKLTRILENEPVSSN